MFFSVLIIALGLAILLNTMGIMSGSIWGYFWAIFFIAAGIKMMISRGKCPMCGWHGFGGKMHNKMHEHCCEGHDHGENEEEHH